MGSISEWGEGKEGPEQMGQIRIEMARAGLGEGGVPETMIQGLGTVLTRGVRHHAGGAAAAAAATSEVHGEVCAAGGTSHGERLGGWEDT